MRTLWDPIFFTNHFHFKIQVKNLLADLSFEIYVKTPVSISKSILKFYANLYSYILWVKLRFLSNGCITGVAYILGWSQYVLLLIWSYSKFWRLFYHTYIPVVLWEVKFKVVHHTQYSSYQYCFGVRILATVLIREVLLVRVYVRQTLCRFLRDGCICYIEGCLAVYSVIIISVIVMIILVGCSNMV